MSDSVLREKSKVFAKDIVYLCREIKAERKETVLANQLLRSATSIGANLHEAQYAQSTNDFISKFEIAQKECYETEYWLELFVKSELIHRENASVLYHQCGTLRRILIASINTAKSNQNQ